MDRRIDIATARAELDELIASVGSDTARTIVARDGQDVAVIMSIEEYRRATAPQPDAFDRIWSHVEAQNLPPMSMDEIDDVIAEVRRDMRKEQAPAR